MLFYALHALILSLAIAYIFSMTIAGKALFCIFIARCFVHIALYDSHRRPTYDNNNTGAFNGHIPKYTNIKANDKTHTQSLNENWSATVHMFVELNST